MSSSRSTNDNRPVTKTPDHVAQLATLSAKAPLRGLMLLGIFGSVDTPKAMIRQTSGRIHTVSVGDQLSGRTVQAIGDDSVYLRRASSLYQLRMP